MCGITGLFCPDGLGRYGAAFEKAHATITHRGPDGQGIAVFDTVRAAVKHVSADCSLLPESLLTSSTMILGHRRLAILDLSAAGFQPMQNEDGTVWISFNGEIYNYIELRKELETAGHVFHSHSDTEVILHAYEQWGEACVDRFNGMWAFVIVDLKRKHLFCSRDRFGIKPLYYYHDGKHFVFGSEIKQLLSFPFVAKRLNERSVYEYLAYAAVEYCEETFFDGIYKLEHGHNLIFDMKNASLKVVCYYNPPSILNEKISPLDAAQEFRRLLVDSVRLHLRSDVEVGSCLSGGLDSSSIVCIMRQLLEEEGKGEIQRTFSSHFADKEADELEYMQAVIDTSGITAHFIYPTVEDFINDIESLVWHQDEPFGSTSIFAQWSVFKLVHRHAVKVMLDGQGADEQLAGYIPLSCYYFRELRAKHRYVRLMREMYCYRQFHPELWDTAFANTFWGKLLRNIRPASAERPAIDWINPRLTERYKDASRYQLFARMSPYGEKEHLNNVLYQITFHTNLQSLLHYEDRNSMAFSVEGRVPFLDCRLVEFVFSLPSHLKVRNGYTKSVLRDGMKNIIPEKIRCRVSKLGFATPEQSWRKTILAPLMETAFEDERLRTFILTEKARDYQEKIIGANLADSASWRWINLHLWMKVYDL